jgi:hypothetical protein
LLYFSSFLFVLTIFHLSSFAVTKKERRERTKQLVDKFKLELYVSNNFILLIYHAKCVLMHFYLRFQKEFLEKEKSDKN